MNKKFISIGIICLLAALSFGIYSSYQLQQLKKNYPQQLQTATVLPAPRTLTDFSFTDNSNHNFTNKNLLNHWSLFFFGFTHCGYVCPTTMGALKNLAALLQQQKITMPQVIMVTIDPERDTVGQLNTYVSSYNPSFIGLTGDQHQIDELASNLNILYIKVRPKNSDDNYDIDHSGAILLINPEGKLAAIFSMPHNAQAIAHDLALIRKYAS